MSLAKILAVDDDKNLLEIIKMRLESSDYEVITAVNEAEAITAVREQMFDLSIIDLHLGHQNGITLMGKLHLINPAMPAIILTAYGSIESAVEAVKRGAYTYVCKPFNTPELLSQIEKALKASKRDAEIKKLNGGLAKSYNFANIVTKSDKMLKVLEQVSRIAPIDSTVCIYGESGTGKELVARSLHLASLREGKNFVAINCAAIPDTLLESELFGYEKGAFTGAHRSTKGLFTEAHEGTIFLDEIGNMPLSTQAKFLRVLQERQFYPIGSKKPMDVDVRVIVATNRDLEDEVKKGNFREDLLYRVHVIPVYLPPLRERKEDIPLLAEYFLKRYSQKMGKTVAGLNPLALQKLMRYDWPGNIRQLENTIEYAVAMTQHNMITEELISLTKTESQEPFHESLKTLKAAKNAFMRHYLINLLKTTKGNVSKAAEMAGQYRTNFHNVLKKHNVKSEDFKEE
jgi:two-component system, NtrC family, response regulator GlrR